MPPPFKTLLQAAQARPNGWPLPRSLVWLILAVLLAHALALLGLTGRLEVRLPAEEDLRSGPLQTRWLPPPPVAAGVPPAPAAPAQTRVATVPIAQKPALQEEAPADRPTPPPADRPVAMAEPAESGPTSTADAVPPALPAPASHAVAASAESADKPAWAPATPSAEGSASNASPAYSAATPLPLMPLGALPASTLLNYRLTGQSKGLIYQASGDLRWQHNEAAYAMSLSVRAFLLGSRQWRSVGAVTAAGLAPTRFSDTARSERAAHFDRDNQKVVFSNNAPVAALSPGAQDQISLHVQLAAAMAGDPSRYQPGTRLEIQTATTRDAVPWLLGVEAFETLPLMGQALPTVKWVCQPRSRFDAKIEFWVAEKYAWMPVRIRISQTTGDFIDLLLSGQEPLPPLPLLPPASPTPPLPAQVSTLGPDLKTPAT